MDILDALPLTSRRKPPVSPSYCNPNPRLTIPSHSLTRKLKRMPHLFTRTLELPFQADTVVKVAESRDSYTFAAWLPGLGARDVKVEVLEIVPGATKVVLRGLECLLPSKVDDLEVCNFLIFPLSFARPSTSFICLFVGLGRRPKLNLLALVPLSPAKMIQQKEENKESMT